MSVSKRGTAGIMPRLCREQERRCNLVNVTSPAVLVFVMRNCGACSEYMPRFLRIVRPFHQKGLGVQIIDVGGDKRSSAFADRLKIKATPTTIVMGRRGPVRREGAITNTEIKKILEQA